MWMWPDVMGKRARASIGSIEFAPELFQEGLQGDDVGGQPAGGFVHRVAVEVGRRKRLVEPRPAAVPGLELSLRKAAFDLDHPAPEELQRGGVQVAIAFE